MVKIKHYKGKHWTLPLRAKVVFGADHKSFQWDAMLPLEAKYDFKDPNDPDEDDWSKFCGISFAPIVASQKNSIMVGWRYKDELDQFQLSPYWHDADGKAHYAENSAAEIFIVEPDKEFYIFIGANQLMVLSQGTRSYKFAIPNIKRSNCAREINSWFGGTDPSPKDFHYWKSQMEVR